MYRTNWKGWTVAVFVRLWSGVVATLAAGAPGAATQQILEVEMDAGREIAGGLEYSFDNAVVDYGRRLVLVSEAADPLAVTAYSLDDGSVQGVFGGGRAGNGPGELMHLSATAVGPDGVFMSGRGRVLYWSWSGALLYQWTPTAPGARVLCALNGRPAVALQKGVVFRGDDGESVALGGEAQTWLRMATPTRAAMSDAAHAYAAIKMACADSSAYVLTDTDHVLTEYKMGAELRSVAMPAELVEAARKRMESSGDVFLPNGEPARNFRKFGYRDLFMAADGRLVIRTYGVAAGAVVDPATGCYALLRDRYRWGGRSYAGMFGDSIVTLESSREPMTRRIVNGKRVPVHTSDDSYIFVRPVRPASGEPCS